MGVRVGRDGEEDDGVAGSTWIYGLLDPELGKLRYVGASIDPVLRYRTHLRCANAHSTVSAATREWIIDLLSRNSKPELVLLEEVPVRGNTKGQRHPEVARVEDAWMVRAVKEGHPLTNAKLPAELVSEDALLFDAALNRGKRLFPTEGR